MYNEEYLDHEAGCSALCLHLIFGGLGPILHIVQTNAMSRLSCVSCGTPYCDVVVAPEAPPKHKQRKKT